MDRNSLSPDNSSVFGLDTISRYTDGVLVKKNHSGSIEVLVPYVMANNEIATFLKLKLYSQSIPDTRNLYFYNPDKNTKEIPLCDFNLNIFGLNEEGLLISALEIVAEKTGI